MKIDNFGNFIKKIRKENNLTQKQLADKYHITTKTVSNWENNRNVPEKSLIKKIKKDFKINDKFIEELNNVEESNSSTEKVDNNIVEPEIMKNEELENNDYTEYAFEDSNEPEEVVFSTTDKALRNKIYVVSLIALSLLIACSLSIKQPAPINDFEYKAITDSCSDSPITVDSTYDSNLKVLYFTNIKYCTEKNNTEYKTIEGTLYAITPNDNEDRAINSYTYNMTDTITLDEYLKNVTLTVDNTICKDELYFEITATNDSAISVYRIPITSTNNCIS